MRDWIGKPEYRLIALAITLLAVTLAGDAYHHLSVKSVPVPTLLFQLLELVLLVGCAATCMLLILRVRVRAMVAATAAMLAVLLGGELYLSVKPVTPPMLLVELLEIALVVGGSIAWAFLARRSGDAASFAQPVPRSGVESRSNSASAPDPDYPRHSFSDYTEGHRRAPGLLAQSAGRRA